MYEKSWGTLPGAFANEELDDPNYPIEQLKGVQISLLKIKNFLLEGTIFLKILVLYIDRDALLGATMALRWSRPWDPSVRDDDARFRRWPGE